MAPKLHHNGSKNGAKNGPKIKPKMRFLGPQNGPKMAPSWPSRGPQEGVNIKRPSRGPQVGHQEASGSVLGASWAVLRRFWGPTWPQLDPQNGHQNDQNSKHFFNPFLNASEDRNFWDFGGFLKPKWTQVDPMLAPKIEVNFERRFFEKTSFFQWKNNNFDGSGGRS